MAGGHPVAALLRPLLPFEVAIAAAPIAGAEPALFEDERAAVARAVAKRRREVAFGRDCARRALAVIGVAPVAVPRGEGGAPQWPAGVLGSITHCDEVAAAAVALAGGAVRGVGIDLESVHAGDVLASVATEAELARHGGLDGVLPLAALLFSAKESVYKCVYPLARRFLEFAEVELVLDAGAGAFEVVRAGAFAEAGALRGRFAIGGGLVATAVVLA